MTKLPDKSFKPVAVESLSDDELFDQIREQVNLSRNAGFHNRTKTRALAAEAYARGWNLRKPHSPNDPR